MEHTSGNQGSHRASRPAAILKILVAAVLIIGVSGAIYFVTGPVGTCSG